MDSSPRAWNKPIGKETGFELMFTHGHSPTILKFVLPIWVLGFLMLIWHWSTQEPTSLSNNGLTILHAYKIFHGRTELPRLDYPAFSLCTMFLFWALQVAIKCSISAIAYLDLFIFNSIIWHHMDGQHLKDHLTEFLSCEAIFSASSDFSVAGTILYYLFFF